MNASTAQRILIATGAFLAGGLLLLFVTGDVRAGDLARQLLVVAIMVGGLFWLGYRFRVLPRRESFQSQAAVQAFHPQVGDPLSLLDQPFCLFRWAGSIRRIENTATGIHGDREMTIADYWFAPSGAAEFDDYERYTCVLTSAPDDWYDLTVVPERFGSRLRTALGIEQINMESEEFNRAFEVRAADRMFASAFVDARMMQWLLDQQSGTGFEVLDGRLIVFRPRAIGSLDDVTQALRQFDAFMARVPRVVRTE